MTITERRTKSGAWGRLLFQATWVLMLAIAIAAPLIGAYSHIKWRAEVVEPAAMAGLRLYGTAGNITLGAPYSEEARSAGMVAGQRLIAVDGRAVRPHESPEDVAGSLGGAEGSVVTLRTRAEDGTERDYRLTRSLEHLRKEYAGAGISWEIRGWIELVAGVLPLWLLTAAGLLLFARRSRSRLSGFMSLTMVMLAGSTLISVGAYPLLGVEKLGQILNMVASMSLILVIILFPTGRLMAKGGWRLLELAILLLIAAQLIDVVVEFISETVGGYVFLASFIGAVVLLASRYRKLPGEVERQQIRWALFGFSICAVFLISGYVCFGLASAASGAGAIWFAILGAVSFALSLLAVAGGLFVSLLRYRLYDADAVIGRSAAFGVLTVVLLGIFAGSQKIIEAMGEELFGEGLGTLAGALGAAIAAAMIVPLHHRANQWAENRFQKQLVKLRRGLPIVLSGVRETATLDRVAATVLDAAVSGVRAGRAALLVRDRVEGTRGVDAPDVEAWRGRWTPGVGNGLECDRDDPLFPMRVPLEVEGHGPVGWLLLGTRPDGSFYGKDERAALAEVAQPIAQALEIAHIRQAERAERDNMLSALKRDVAELRDEMFRLFKVRRVSAAE